MISFSFKKIKVCIEYIYMKFSVIIPCYNESQDIVKNAETIKEYLNAHQIDYELIIVNDETPDNSINIIKENFNDKRIKIFNKKNGGAASARNFGINKAIGDFIFFVDSDDYIEKNTLEDMYNLAMQDNTDLVICDYYKLYENYRSKFLLFLRIFLISALLFYC